MGRWCFLAWVFFFWLLSVSGSRAHFQLLIPNRDFVTPSEREIVFEILFTHPMEGGPTMEMAPPKAFGVMIRGEKLDLVSCLKTRKVPVYPFKENSPLVTAYQARFLPKRPGDHLFYLVPQPYFEPDEGKFIQQITKVVVNAYGAEEGWDQPIGLKVEIIPFTRPYGLFEGNLFRGQVLLDGKPAAEIPVEVEYYNQDGKIKVEGPFTTQVIKTDQNGFFSFAFPWAGWWGFSALTEGGTLLHQGKPYPLELDAVIWIKAYPRPK